MGNALGSTLTVLHFAQKLDSFDSVAQFEVIVPIISLEALYATSEVPESDTIQVGLPSGILWSETLIWPTID